MWLSCYDKWYTNKVPTGNACAVHAGSARARTGTCCVHYTYIYIYIYIYILMCLFVHRSPLGQTRSRNLSKGIVAWLLRHPQNLSVSFQATGKKLTPHEPLKKHRSLLNPRKPGLWHLLPPLRNESQDHCLPPRSPQPRSSWQHPDR